VLFFRCQCYLTIGIANWEIDLLHRRFKETNSIMYNDEIPFRWETREIAVGNVGIGGNNPIRIQSMTTSRTCDVDATIDQIIRLSDGGCEIARVTVQGKREAEACEHIKNILVQKGYMIPIVADIHFYPAAAMKVVEYVDKVRINPGNYLDKRASFKVLEYTDASYLEELRRLEENFVPLVLKCKKLGRAMRIGVNHGSLSDRIMSRYGDTPEGMVESAFEYAEVCRKNDFYDIIFSIKSSNTKVMIGAYRLLVGEMIKRGWDYPIHLGVTEAGGGEDGRVKSAIGIGALLLDGIGDTIRVSLTEDPWFEIDPCRRLVAIAEEFAGECGCSRDDRASKLDIIRRNIEWPTSFPLHRDGTVGVSIKCSEVASSDVIGMRDGDSGIDIVRAYGNVSGNLPGFVLTDEHCASLCDAEPGQVVVVADEPESEWKRIELLSPPFILLKSSGLSRVRYARKFFSWLRERELSIPVILNFAYDGEWNDVVIRASAECGALLCDGLGEGVLLEGSYSIDLLRDLSFAILQGARMRSVKTEFISCPGCGRTLFDLQAVVAMVRRRLGNFPGVKVAIMGCIVNGPGEMADADFGYVGSGVGKVDLYVGKECVQRGISHEEAPDRLSELVNAYSEELKKSDS